MTTLFEPAFAKINLTLDVLGKRDDGFHDIKTVMQTISLRDDVEIDVGTGKPWVLKCDKEGIPCDERNLAWKAAKLFEEVTGKDLGGIEIRITKRIPSEAGLAGGSADAAAVLRALNEHFGAPLSIGALAEVGGQIGSDIPFCVIGGTCMCEGRGEKLRRLPNMPECVIVICKPDFGVSTPALYILRIWVPVIFWSTVPAATIPGLQLTRNTTKQAIWMQRASSPSLIWMTMA